MASGGGPHFPPTEEESLGAPSGCMGELRQTPCWSPQGTLGTGSVGPPPLAPAEWTSECTLLLQVEVEVGKAEQRYRICWRNHSSGLEAEIPLLLPFFLLHGNKLGKQPLDPSDELAD